MTTTTDRPIADLNATLTPEDWHNVAVFCTAVGVLATDEQVAEIVAKAAAPEDLRFEDVERLLLDLELDRGRLLGHSLLGLPRERSQAGLLVGLRYAQGMSAEDLARMRACRAA
jgi:hypothetical protein